ncbi:Uncharacterised protein [Bordetella pertussis]|nr:Uncharacterised protein [Bordetella pertussis]
MVQVMTSGRPSASAAWDSQDTPMLVSRMPASGPGAHTSFLARSRLSGLRRSSATERFCLFRPVQYRLVPPGMRGMRS